jgi:hypothetical protein
LNADYGLAKGKGMKREKGFLFFTQTDKMAIPVDCDKLQIDKITHRTATKKGYTNRCSQNSIDKLKRNSKRKSSNT